MAIWESLKRAINSAIKKNDNQEITGQVLNSALLSIINSIGLNASYIGLVEPNMSISQPEGPVFYIATTPGVYANCGGFTVNSGEIAILKWNDKGWSKDTILSNMGSTDLPVATENALGGIQLGYPTAGRNYAVQLFNNKAFVNVPWTNTTYKPASLEQAGLMTPTQFEGLSNLLARYNPSYNSPVELGHFTFVDGEEYIIKERAWGLQLINDSGLLEQTYEYSIHEILGEFPSLVTSLRGGYMCNQSGDLRVGFYSSENLFTRGDNYYFSPIPPDIDQSVTELVFVVIIEYLGAEYSSLKLSRQRNG